MIAALLGCILAFGAQAALPSMDDLRDATASWFAVRLAVDGGADGALRAHADRLRREALALWHRAARDPTLLQDQPRLAAVFHGCFPYDPVQATGAVQPWAGVDGISIRIPAGYAPQAPSAALVVVFDGAIETLEAAAARATAVVDERWLVLFAPVDRLAELTRATPATVDAGRGLLLVAGALATRLGLTNAGTGLLRRLWPAPPGLQEHVRGLFALLGAVQRRLHLDRDRLLLDGSGAGCAVAQRAAATAPDRFAGLVLHSPPGLATGHVENLALVPVLVVEPKPGPKARRLLAELQAAPGSDCVLHEGGSGDPAVGEWLRGRRRDLFRRRLAFVMEEDAIVDGFWLQVDAADFSAGGAGARRASIEATADRASNTIAVNARHVDAFTLLLNDALVDLDRPLRIEVNGVRAVLRRLRNVEFLLESVYGRFDPAFVFTTTISLPVPRRS